MRIAACALLLTLAVAAAVPLREDEEAVAPATTTVPETNKVLEEEADNAARDPAGKPAAQFRLGVISPVNPLNAKNPPPVPVVSASQVQIVTTQDQQQPQRQFVSSCSSFSSSQSETNKDVNRAGSAVAVNQFGAASSEISIHN
ncbi:Hypothetical predicted protein [Cloeon dipterum]|uniref:Uncharacterized protein n=1 Tax=Cloeon dipterum TaxID=197152 RepID=A0A8S1CX12_9INSE|nr:Hypothetical predicted protein [Cloeon dipterum]